MQNNVERKYPRISDYYNQISNYPNYDCESHDWFWRSSQCDEIEHFFGAEGASDYEIVVKAVKELGFDTVFDIGCASGFQSECFLNENIRYIGVDDDARVDKWNNDKFDYLIGKYPFQIPNEFLSGKYVGISRMCVGILINNEAHLKQMSETFTDLIVCDNHYQSRLLKFYNLVSVFKGNRHSESREATTWYYYQKK